MTIGRETLCIGLNIVNKMATQHSLWILVGISLLFVLYSATASNIDDAICGDDECDWEAQYCCANNTCCNFQCTGNYSCDTKTHYCCENQTCCQYDCNGGCQSDQFCCGRNPFACCSDGYWHAEWWTWLLVSVVCILLVLIIVFVCRSSSLISRPRVPTYRSSQPYGASDERGLESSMKHVPNEVKREPAEAQQPVKSTTKYQSFS